jgi:hypothetical protein
MQKIVFVSIPKCGTHFLLRYLDFVGFRNIGPYGQISYESSMLESVDMLGHGDYTAWHYPWSQDIVDRIVNVGARVILLFRDPRDYIVSNLHHIIRVNEHRLHTLLAIHVKTHHERVLRLIRGIIEAELVTFSRPRGDWDLLLPETGKGPLSTHSAGVNEIFRFFARWLDEPFVFPVRFEDIIGPQGGGSRERQLEVLQALLAFTGAKEGSPDAEALAGMLFSSDATTFRKGQIGSWREEFTPELYEVFLQESRELLELWGYDPEEGLT